MDVFFKRSFLKQYDKLPQNIQEQFDERLLLFQSSSRDRLLNIHNLHGKRKGYLSMNVTSDYRALFVWEDKETVVFREIGTHSQLYG